MDWVFLTVGGFLVGAFLYSGYFTTRYKPEVKLGYVVVGAGIVVTVAVNTWVDFTHDVSDWFRASVLLGYALVAAGLVVIVRGRRRRHR